MIGYPDPNYGIKVINYNKLPSPIMSSPSASLCITQRPLSFTFVRPNTEFYISSQREFSIDLKNKVINNIQGQLPLSKQKRAKGCFRFYYKETSFWNSNHDNVISVQWRSQKYHQFYKKNNFYNVSFSRVFQKKCKNTLLWYPKHKGH